MHPNCSAIGRIHKWTKVQASNAKSAREGDDILCQLAGVDSTGGGNTAPPAPPAHAAHNTLPHQRTSAKSGAAHAMEPPRGHPPPPPPHVQGVMGAQQPPEVPTEVGRGAQPNRKNGPVTPPASPHPPVGHVKALRSIIKQFAIRANAGDARGARRGGGRPPKRTAHQAQLDDDLGRVLTTSPATIIQLYAGRAWYKSNRALYDVEKGCEKTTMQQMQYRDVCNVQLFAMGGGTQPPGGSNGGAGNSSTQNLKRCYGGAVKFASLVEEVRCGKKSATHWWLQSGGAPQHKAFDLVGKHFPELTRELALAMAFKERSIELWRLPEAEGGCKACGAQNSPLGLDHILVECKAYGKTRKWCADEALQHLQWNDIETRPDALRKGKAQLDEAIRLRKAELMNKVLQQGAQQGSPHPPGSSTRGGDVIEQVASMAILTPTDAATKMAINCFFPLYDAQTLSDRKQWIGAEKWSREVRRRKAANEHKALNFLFDENYLEYNIMCQQQVMMKDFIDLCDGIRGGNVGPWVKRQCSKRTGGSPAMDCLLTPVGSQEQQLVLTIYTALLMKHVVRRDYIWSAQRERRR